MVSLGSFSLPKQREEHKKKSIPQEIAGQARNEGLTPRLFWLILYFPL